VYDYKCVVGFNYFEKAVMLILEKLTEKFNSIKTLPHVAIRLTKMLSIKKFSIADYEEVIKYDPALVMRLFRLVNSAFFSLPEKVETISDAISFAGIDNLRNMVVVEALRDIFSDGNESEQFSRKKLWLHSVATAVCARKIAEDIYGIKGEDSFLCGLLHDIGMVVEHQCLPEKFNTMLLAYDNSDSLFTDHEKTHIGVNHCETGFWLARSWKLPAVVQFGIRDHHLTQNNVKTSDISSIIQLAEFIVARMGYAIQPEVQPDLPKPLLRHMENHIRKYQHLLNILPDEIKKTTDVYLSKG